MNVQNKKVCVQIKQIREVPNTNQDIWGSQGLWKLLANNISAKIREKIRASG